MTTNYISFIKRKEEENKSSTKYFYIIIKYSAYINDKQVLESIEELANNYLNDCYFKIKESLSRCGNIIYDVNSKKECEEILGYFFNPNKRQV